MAADRPLLNPVLRLRVEPKPEPVTGGGKSQKGIVTQRLAPQQKSLSAAATHLYARRDRLPNFGGRLHLMVKMFVEDSLAPSWVPDDLFAPITGCQLVAPVKHGYLIESTIESLPTLTDAIRHPRGYAVMCDISRVKSVAEMSAADRLHDLSAEELWKAALDGDKGKSFVIWLAPFRNREAQESLVRAVEKLTQARTLLPLQIRQADLDGASDASRAVSIPPRSSIEVALQHYRGRGFARAEAEVPNIDALKALVASGVSHRIDPVRPIHVAAPGEGTDPQPPANLKDAPIVGVIDGGLHAKSYAAAEAWKTVPLYSNAEADHKHGNAVSSLVVQGHAWNANRHLPALDCRIGSVQAVPNATPKKFFTEREVIDYLAAVMRAHPETKVWNISANQPCDGSSHDQISLLGYELNLLCRAAGTLPVISIGNRLKKGDDFPAPPADCEAAIVVGGRKSDKRGYPSDPCPVCLCGPGPDGMLKPDMSWFSELRFIGGVVAKGSSYATPLVSSLAAHTFQNLRDPTPDIVKALLINECELAEHDCKLGWGTPFQGRLPWVCDDGTVTMVWKAELEPGARYYWNEIAIPPEMIEDGKLVGRASLTAILRPLTSPLGGSNYFASRLETSLKYADGTKWKPLLGTMKESTLEEAEARSELKKWQPVRRHCRDFSKRGLKASGPHFQLYARVFTRDLYQFAWPDGRRPGLQKVAFVLSLSGKDKDSSIYNSTVKALGNRVESAVLNLDIGIHNR